MKLIPLILALFWVTGSLCYGQKQNREVYPEQVSINHNDAVKKFSRDFVSTMHQYQGVMDMNSMMLGINNAAYVSQVGNDNTAILYQKGNGNVGIIDMEGNGNSSELNQNGNYLLSLLKLKGNYNSLDFDQSGNRLGAMFYLEGQGLNFDAVQNESGMQLLQGGSSIPLLIRHSGGTTPIIISNH